MLSRQDNNCYICKLPVIDPNQARLHHLLPMSQGGKTNLNNLVAVHKHKFCIGPRGRLKAELHIKQFGLCVICNEKLDDNFTIDHIVPKSKGGSNYITNLQLVHLYCNRIKSNRIESAQTTRHRVKTYKNQVNLSKHFYHPPSKECKKALKRQYKSKLDI